VREDIMAKFLRVGNVLLNLGAVSEVDLAWCVNCVRVWFGAGGTDDQAFRDFRDDDAETLRRYFATSADVLDA